jgi:hypothetical protein
LKGSDQPVLITYEGETLLDTHPNFNHLSKVNDFRVQFNYASNRMAPKLPPQVMYQQLNPAWNQHDGHHE